MNFGSDNVWGASQPVLDALVRANAGAQAAYGEDEGTKRVERRFAEIFERDVAVVLAGTGTGVNALAVAAAVPPWGSVICHREAHIIDDECGAPEFFSHGAKLYGLPGVGAKLDPQEITAFIDGLPKAVKQMPPKLLSISQVNECGLVYSRDEIAALSAVCRSRGMALHMDGARFANALVRLGCPPAEMTWKQGVDILTFGATKNGCFAAEAIVVFDNALAETLGYRRKRGGHLFSKGRLVSAQLEGYFADDHWLANARHANAMAARLSEGLSGIPGVRLAWPCEANEVFPILPRAADEALQAAGFLYRGWSEFSLPERERVGPAERLVRLVTSWATEEASVERFLAVARAASAQRAAE
jgi:threonine aldolase